MIWRITSLWKKKARKDMHASIYATNDATLREKKALILSSKKVKKALEPIIYIFFLFKWICTWLSNDLFLEHLTHKSPCKYIAPSNMTRLKTKK